MVDETRNKILGAALKIFAEKGYKGATTRGIAAEAGVNDSTLFRKFRTKENLFNQVLIQNNEKMIKDIDSIIIDKKFNTSRDFLETLIRNVIKVAEDNYEHIRLTMNEGSRTSENIMDKFVTHFSKYVEENIPNKEINYPVFLMAITAFIYLIINDKHQGRLILNHEEIIEIFIDNTAICFKD